MITKIDDIKPLLRLARTRPTSLVGRLRQLAASPSWQEREVAATAMVQMSRRHPDVVLTMARRWARARDPNVRRAAAEGLRGLVQCQPVRVRAVLELVRDDSHLYVKKSVANVLRNATRVQPDFVLQVCAEWAQSKNPHTHWIIREGLRKMKAPHALEASRILSGVAVQAAKAEANTARRDHGNPR
jgi:3-methyladenine DNA glycosylase AlkC